MYSERATKFCEIFPLLLTVCSVVKSKGKISQNFVVFSEYMNFKKSNEKSALCLEIVREECHSFLLKGAKWEWLSFFLTQ